MIIPKTGDWVRIVHRENGEQVELGPVEVAACENGSLIVFTRGSALIGSRETRSFNLNSPDLHYYDLLP